MVRSSIAASSLLFVTRPAATQNGLSGSVLDECDTSGLDFRERPPARSLEAALPDSEDAPARGQEVSYNAFIPLAVSRDFGSPEFRPCSGQPEQRAVMAMPEASMNENDRPEAWEDHVRTSRHGLDVQTEPQACRMHSPAQEYLGPGVATADAAHVPPPLFRGKIVCHVPSPYKELLLTWHQRTHVENLYI